MEYVIGAGLVLFAILILGIRIDQEYERGVIFRLGRFLGVKGPGSTCTRKPT